MTAIPENSYSYLISEHAESTHDALVDDELYVFETYEADDKLRLELRRMDLCTGKEMASWKGFASSDVYNTRIIIQDDMVISRGARNLVFDRFTLEEIYSEDSVLESEWENGGFSFICNGFYYRYREALPRVGGIDVVDMETQSKVDFLDCDIKCRMLPYKGVLYGERVNGNFALYSINNKTYTLELNSDVYGEIKGRGLRYCIDNGYIYLLCGEYVLVVDVEKHVLVKEIRYTSSPLLSVLLQEGGRRAVADLISVSDGVIVLSSYNRPGWVAMINANKSDNILWIVKRDKVTIANAKGDLIYAKEGSYPVAMDKYTGEVVWSAKNTTNANEIHVGTSWVVYSFLAGKLQCFRMNDEIYVSPEHPKS